MFEAILRDLRQPENVHVLLNPLPVYGLAVGLIGLLVAICLRSRAATVAALIVVFIALIAPVKWPGLSIWLGVAVLVLGAIALGGGGYVAYAGGRIRHREFRNEPPPKGAREAAAGAVAPAAQPVSSVAPAAVKVTIKSLKYFSDTTQIKTGETVEWVNNDLTPHTVTSDNGGELNSGSIDAGATWRHTFSQAGTFAYFCTFHREMKGTVIVK